MRRSAIGNALLILLLVPWTVHVDLQAQGGGGVEVGNQTSDPTNGNGGGNGGTTPFPPGGNTTPTKPLTVEQAEATLPPPLPVVVLTPANVFDSPDPAIRAAWQAYLATLKGPRDRYGNLITDNYVGAQRPDTVDTAIVTFIAKEVAGKVLVALNATHGAGLANLQRHQRNTAIRQIIFNSMSPEDQRRILAQQGGNGAGGTQDPAGPQAPGNTPTNNPGGNNPQTPGSPTNENVPDIGDVNETDDRPPAGSDDPPAPGVAGDIEKQFNIRIAIEPKEFSPEELGLLRDALARMPASYYKDLPTVARVPVIKEPSGTPCESCYGVTFSAWDPTTHERRPARIEISDLYQTLPASRMNEGGFPFRLEVYGTEQVARTLLFRHTVFHEFGHHYIFVFGDRHNPKQDHPVVKKFAEQFGWTPDASDSRRERYTFDCAGRKLEIPSAYAYEGNLIGEDLAESVGYYFTDPNRLVETAAPASAQGRSRLQFVEAEMELAGRRQDPPKTQIPDCQEFICPCGG